MPNLRRLPCSSFLLFFAATFFVACLAVSSSAFAQTELAGVYGRVTDQSGAVIVDADVEIKNVETNQSVTVKTNHDGLYTIPSLHPGHYLISARKPGFKTVTVTQLELNIQDNVVRNFALQVGSIAETVTITADDFHLNTTDGSVSTVVDQTYIKNMPLNGRSFQSLILLTPGVVTQTPQPLGGPSGLGLTGEFSVNGQRPESNYYSVDGVSGNVGGSTSSLAMILGAGPSGSVAASTALGSTQALVSVDALQEFRVQSSTYSAEYGRNPGGQFAFETKSGTNQWHGTAFDYLRNDLFDATDYFTNYFRSIKPSLRKTALRQNDFGGTLGGPIRIPRLYNGKDKTFFFFSYEGLRLVAPQAAATSFVPDAALRSSAPAALQQALNAFPVQSPNGIDDTANGVGQFIGTWSNPSSLDSTGVRFDHAVNDKLRLFFRFSDTSSASTIRGKNGAPTVNTTSSYTLRTYTAGASSVVTSRLSNDFRLNYSSNEMRARDVIDAFGGSIPVNLAQLVGLGTGSSVALTLFIGGNSPGLQQQQQSGYQKQWNFVDTVSLTSGRHQLKFGVDYRRLTPFAARPSPAATFLYFNKSGVQTNSGTALLQSIAPYYPLFENSSAFAQDQWKVGQRLSLSLGLRWEVNPPPGATQGLKPYTFQGSSLGTATLAPQGTPLWQTTWYNFAPRLGITYLLHDAPGRETVVRGGGGVFFDTGQQLGSSAFGGPGFNAFQSVPGSSFPTLPPGGFPNIVNPPVPQYSTFPYGFAPHLQLPYTLQWSASIDQALGSSQALRLSYVGSHASRLLQRNQFTVPGNPNATFFILIQNGLTSDYESLQAQFQRRLSRGLTALGSYTWSHCQDYGSQNYVFGYLRGNCDFDVRHNFSGAFSYDLPNVGQNGFVNAVLHHWGIDNRLTARTGFPVTLSGNTITDSTGVQSHAGLNLQGCPGNRAINPQAFANVSSGRGNAPRNFAQGFGAWQMDLAIRRTFPLTEGVRLQFRAEAFNVFNHPNFGAINPNFGSSTFGQATASLANSLGILSPLYQVGGPRSMQFALKLVF